jgi:hypothetical protein
MPSRPVLLTALGALQFLGFAVACMVLLGDGTLDGELSVADVAGAVAVAIAGALVVGSTFSGGKVAWWFELLLGLAAVVVGIIGFAGDDAYGLPLAALGVVWLVVAAMPQSRAWFLRPSAQ